MTTDKDLHTLILAWDRGEPGAGAALYDAMEELNWPWEWEKDDHQYWLYMPGFKTEMDHVATFRISDLDWSIWKITRHTFGEQWRILNSASRHNSKPVTSDEAQTQAEAALKEHLRNS